MKEEFESACEQTNTQLGEDLHHSTRVELSNYASDEVVSDIFASLAVVFPKKNINFSKHKWSAKPNGRARVHRHSNHESNSLRK